MTALLPEPAPTMTIDQMIEEVPAQAPFGEGITGKTESSQQIADVTGKRHAHIIRDIEHVLDALGISPSKLGSAEESKNQV